MTIKNISRQDFCTAVKNAAAQPAATPAWSYGMSGRKFHLTLADGSQVSLSRQALYKQLAASASSAANVDEVRELRQTCTAINTLHENSKAAFQNDKSITHIFKACFLKLAQAIGYRLHGRPATQAAFDAIDGADRRAGLRDVELPAGAPAPQPPPVPPRVDKCIKPSAIKTNPVLRARFEAMLGGVREPV